MVRSIKVASTGQDRRERPRKRKRTRLLGLRFLMEILCGRILVRSMVRVRRHKM